MLIQLKILVEQLEVNANIDDSYNAMVADNEEVSKKIRAENNRLTNIVTTLQVTLIIFVVALIAIVLLLWRYTNFVQRRRNGFQKKLDIQQQSTVISISIVSFHLLIYILALDGVALYNRENPPDQELSVIYRNEKPGDPFSVFYNLPLIVMIFDVIVAIFSFAMLVTALLNCIIRLFKPDMKKLWVLFLRLSSIGPVLTLLMHAPFITNAYLHDSFHAHSIFIYYAVAIFVGFLLLKKIAILTCLSSVWQAKHAEWKKPVKNTKVIICQGTLKFKKNGSKTVQAIKLAGGNLTLNCDNVSLVRKRFIVSNDSHIEVKGGKLTLHDSDQLNGNFKSADSYEELHIEEGSLQVQQCDQCDEEVAIDSTKLKLAKGGILNVSYNGKRCLVIRDGTLVGKELECMCLYKCLNTVPGAATCFILTTIVMALFFLSMLSLLACYFILIPINMSISNAADRLIGIYHSFFFIVGAFFAYKTFFKSEHSSIQEAVTGRKKPLTEGEQGAKWRSMSDKEKLDEFYGIVVDIVAQHYTCNNEETV